MFVAFYSISERKIYFRLFCCLFCFCFYFLNALQSDKITTVIQLFMFLGINIFWALLRAHFKPCLTAYAKMNLRQAQNKFLPMNMNSIVLLARALQATVQMVDSTLHWITQQVFVENRKDNDLFAGECFPTQKQLSLGHVQLNPMSQE